MSILCKEYELRTETIEKILTETQNYCSQLNIERRQSLRVTLTLEELLLGLMNHYGAEKAIAVGFGKYRGRQIIRLQYEGEPFDPIEQAEDEWTGNIMASLGLSPVWTYRRKTNTVSITIADRRQKGTLFYIAVAAALGTVLGILGHHFPEAVWSFIDTNILSPAMSAYMGLLNTFSGIMIAFTICSGILGFGDSVVLVKTGKGIIARFSLLMVFVSIFGMSFMQPFVKLNWSGEDAGSSQAGALAEMIFGIVPKNLIEPFLSGNAIQIIVIALCIGTMLLIVGERARYVKTFVTEGTEVLQRLTSSVCSLIPIYVFMALAQLIGAKDGTVLLSLWKPLCLAFAGQSVLMLILLLWTAAQIKCSPILLLKKVLPPFLVAFTTASSMSAFTLSMETSEKDIGLDSSFVKFCYPVCSVMFMPATAVCMSSVLCCFAESYEVGVSLTWMIAATITISLLAIATPPMPGACVLMYSILFAQLGIPSEAFLLAVAANLITDFYDTGYNVMGLLLEMPREGHRLGYLDRSVLLSDPKR
ncbi:MAG: cation:dicarboxylase symporter family transporter [Ruminiclostridium sp.]|nr:cation:dicarboxylase symporter family transporter [Ruminiclostridium sp.]